MTISDPSMHLRAKLSNTKNVNINGRDIVLENGDIIDEILVFSPGNNIIEFVLEDNFGKKKKYQYHIFYKTRKQDYPQNIEEARKKQEEKQMLENELIKDKQ